MRVCTAICCLAWGVVLTTCTLGAAQSQDKPATTKIDFSRDIQPILAAHCYRCHGPKEQEAGLRLDVRRRALAGGDSGRAIVAADSSQSLLWQRISAADRDEAMPPDGKTLSRQQQALMRAWIEQGASWPDEWAGREDSLNHWAFQPIRRPAVPAVLGTSDVARGRNAIDGFVLMKLEHQGIASSEQADRATLIRRLSFDLLGLPPTVNEVDAFLSDDRPDAYERLVDRLLASPRFGERWGRHWLDLARYADSGGYEADLPRTIWRYRDWVIDAINADMPFPQFVLEQLAGDLLPDASPEQRIATGFHCNAMLDPNLRWEAVIDRVNTTGTLFLGLTVACAQCHSHKTDPITQRDYYRLYAFFNSASMTDLDLASPQLRTRREAMQKQADGVKEKMSQCATSLARNLADWEQQLTDKERRILSPAVQQLLVIAPDRRTDEQTRQVVTARIERDTGHRQLTEELDRLKKQMPKLPTSPVMHHTGGETHLFLRGNHEQLGERVSPGVPSFLSPLTDSDSRTRVELAQWLTARENPLTARVAMNRLWQRDFGRGLVDTENDFGIQTAPPSHPDLLDWLASEFLDGGGRMKRMHRLIVSSATYRQSSTLRPELLTADPENRWFARQRRFRLEAEILRDSSLAVAGAISSKIGGPSVFPQQPDGVLDYRATKANWVVSTGEDRYRRGMYTWFWRLTPHPMLTLFDAPDGTAACTRRDRSNTPVQALTLLNDPLFVDCARMLAARVLGECAGDDRERLRHAFQLCLARKPNSSELSLLSELLIEQRRELSHDVDSAEQIVGEFGDKPLSGAVDRAELAAWTVVCRALINLDEFLTRE